MTSTTNYKTEIRAFNSSLQDQFRIVGIDKLLENKSDLIDRILIEIWQKNNLCDSGISLNAVGGYGRKELHPFSDIDISIITSSSPSPGVSESLQCFITDLWDLGLDVGHSVRTLKEANAEIDSDIVTATNMLDIRLLYGEVEHSEIILSTLYDNKLWSSKGFWRAKFEEQKHRHNIADSSGINMQPDLKNGPGGLRDIQTIIWVARKHFSVSDPDSLNKLGYFTNEEYSELRECQYFIWRIRWCLHHVAERAENKLLIEYQAEVAELMGFGDKGDIAIEKMMRQTLRAMKRVYELNHMLMLFLDDKSDNDKNKDLFIINDAFEIRGGLIHARREDVFVERKQIMSMLVLIAEYDEKISSVSPKTLRLLRQVRRRILGDLQDFYECRQEFLKLFRSKHGLGTALTIMQRHSILSVYFPQWRETVGQIQFDLFHDYTVDEHTYRALKVLYKFSMLEVDKFNSFAANIYNTLNKKIVLIIAIMFHDIAKGRGGNYTVLGAIDAAQFAEFHALKESEVRLIKWLVENQTLLSNTAQQQDVFDIDVVSEFAKKVGTQEKLDMLFCLTVADANATNDKYWNDWKANLAKHLYETSKKALRNGLENLMEYKSVVKENKSEALRKLNAEGFSEIDLRDKVATLWRKIPTSFFGRFNADEIAYYTSKILRNQINSTVISVESETAVGQSEIFVYIKDRKGLFVTLFKTLSNLNISIQEAHIAVTSDGFVIETLKILDVDNQPIKDPFRLQEIETRLNEVLLEGKEIQEPKEPRFIGVFDSYVKVDYLNSRKKNKTLLNISCPNNPQLMEKICTAFQSLELNIQSAKINTIGEAVDNIFLLSNKKNHRLTKKECEELEQKIVNTLQ